MAGELSGFPRCCQGPLSLEASAGSRFPVLWKVRGRNPWVGDKLADPVIAAGDPAALAEANDLLTTETTLTAQKSVEWPLWLR